jgi:Tol biopolymer transport system component
MRGCGVLASMALLLNLLAADAAYAAFSGANGRIAFVDNGKIWTVNPDGSAPQQLTSPASPLTDRNPSWSPDGTRIAFDRGQPSSTRDLYVVNADGTGDTLLATAGHDPTWSPDGSEVAFLDHSDTALYRINADGTNRHYQGDVTSVTDCCPSDPAWSPNGTPFVFGAIYVDVFCDPFDPGGECDAVNNNFLAVRPPGSTCGECYQYLSVPGSYPDWSPTGRDLVYTTARIRVDYYTWSGTDGEIAAVNEDGTSDRRTLVAGPEIDEQPAWSPDGTKIVFRRSTGTAPGLWVVGADGSGAARILGAGSQPDWQPVQRPYVRPAGATPLRVPLVPAFNECTAPNLEHGPPLAFGSCAPPEESSPNLSVGVGDGDPSFSRSVGFVRFRVDPGTPGGPDDTDVRVRFSLSNVMRATDLSEYTGELRATAKVRLTDKQGTVSSTTQDFPVEWDVPCLPTAATLDKSLCDLATTLDSIVPGAAPERTRAVWALDEVKVYDGGPDEDGGTTGDNALFAVQGVFVP